MAFLMTRTDSSRRHVLGAALLSLTISAAFWPGAIAAQENDNWEFRITPYMWMLSLDGTTVALGSDLLSDSRGNSADKPEQLQLTT